jgi:ATP-dependent exoDNAse (exonuclease V) alpha subunit
LPTAGVVLVDEAAMVGTRALSKLWAAAERSGAKLVLVGDHRQVPEIEAGGAFGALAKALEAPELTENRRQGEAWERAALAELRSGTPARAVEAYASHGRVVLAETAVEARRAMVGQWWAARAGGADAVMFAVTRSDVEALNRLARGLARDGGHLGVAELVSGGRAFSVGDDVLTLRPDSRLGVLNGTLATVTALDLGAGSLTVATKKGGSVVLPPAYLEAGHLGWGYAMTLHKGQGATVDRAFLLGGDGLYREAGYTGLSRGRASNDVYLVAGGSFVDEEHDRRTPVRDPIEVFTSSLNRSRAQSLALEAGHDPAHPLRTELGSMGVQGARRGTRAVVAPADHGLEVQAREVGAWESLRRRLAARLETNFTRAIERDVGQDIHL